MKKILIGAAVTAMSLFSACNDLELQEEPVASGASGGASEQVYFTATIDAATKVYLQYDGTVYKTCWEEGDAIRVYNDDTKEYEDCPIVEGAGTTTARFAGTIKADNYVAFYGDVNYSDYSDSYSCYMSSWTGDEYDAGEEKVEFGSSDFFMMAQSTTKNFSFQNLGSVLKLSITGDGEYLNEIKVKANDGSAVCGSAVVVADASHPYIQVEDTEDEYYHELGCSVYETLSSTPIESCFILPPRTYQGGITVTLLTDNGEVSFSATDDIEMNPSRIRNMNISLSEGTVVSPEEVWVIEITEDNGASWSVTQNLTYEDGMYVYQDLYCGSSALYMRFLETNSGTYYGCSAAYVGGQHKTNARVGLVSGGNWWWLGLSFTGYYDIYIDPMEGCFYIMSDGCLPGELPVDRTVICDQYEDIAAVSEGEWVKIHGVVLAQTSYGFVVAIDGYYYNNAYVYDRAGLCSVQLGDWVDIYAKVETYRGLPELVVEEGAYWCRKLLEQYYDYNSEPPVSVTNISEYYPGKYEYFRYNGTLNGSSVIGEDKNSVTITNQTILDLTQYDGQKVCVEGYFAGRQDNAIIPAMFLKRIYLINDDTTGEGSSEDIIPGDSFIVS